MVCLTFVTLADEFVALTGLGSAAGFLAMRGLFGLGSGNASTVNRSEESETTTTSTSNANSPGEQPDVQTGMSDEAKEQSLEDLGEKIQRLMDLGVIQVITKPK